MGIFSFFGKKSSRLDKPVDLSVLQTDIHSHFIPGIDDGAKTMEDSLLMVARMQELGYKKVITTPHVMSDFYKNTPEIILEGLAGLKLAASNAGLTIGIEAAAEYYVDYEFEQKLKEGQLLTFGKNYVLIEVSFLNPPENLADMIFKLQTAGYKPILAHPERYPYWYNDFEQYVKLKDKGALLQLNLNSLTGYYSPETKTIAEKLIDNDMIDLLGTDCHHAGHLDLLAACRFEPYLEKVMGSGRLLNATL